MEGRRLTWLGEGALLASAASSRRPMMVATLCTCLTRSRSIAPWPRFRVRQRLGCRPLLVVFLWVNVLEGGILTRPDNVK